MQQEPEDRRPATTIGGSLVAGALGACQRRLDAYDEPRGDDESPCDSVVDEQGPTREPVEQGTYERAPDEHGQCVEHSQHAESSGTSLIHGNPGHRYECGTVA